MAYKANRGGHAPGHLREAFLDWLEEHWQDERWLQGDTVEVSEKVRPIRWLIGQLWNCTDALPGDECELLGLDYATYAVAVRKVAQELE